MSRTLDVVRLKSMLTPYAPASLHLGRHRKAQLTPLGVELRLHDKPIVTISGDKKTVTLNLCGLWTTGTVRAMSDYLRGAGLDIKPSLARGEFSARYQGRTHKASFDNTIKIEI